MTLTRTVRQPLRMPRLATDAQQVRLQIKGQPGRQHAAPGLALCPSHTDHELLGTLRGILVVRCCPHLFFVPFCNFIFFHPAFGPPGWPAAVGQVPGPGRRHLRLCADRPVERRPRVRPPRGFQRRGGGRRRAARPKPVRNTFPARGAHLTLHRPQPGALRVRGVRDEAAHWALRAAPPRRRCATARRCAARVARNAGPKDGRAREAAKALSERRGVHGPGAEARGAAAAPHRDRAPVAGHRRGRQPRVRGRKPAGGRGQVLAGGAARAAHRVLVRQPRATRRVVLTLDVFLQFAASTPTTMCCR